MAIELRILTGARGGHRERFDKRVIALGRHLDSDLRFDPNEDLDVSAHHAEILGDASGRYRIRDSESTNGTFLNGRRIADEESLTDGDVIWLGAEGPRVEVRIPSQATQPMRPDAFPEKAVRQQRSSTGERVRAAIRRETVGMRLLLVLILVLLVGGIGGAVYWLGRPESPTPVSMQVLGQGTATLDVATIGAENEAAVAFLAAELDGKPFGGTAFGVAPNGLLVTNKHNVRSPITGRPATRLAVKYANTNTLLHAHVVQLAPDSSVDLALIQVDEPGVYPIVAGVVRTLADIRVGSRVVTIGFPHAFDLPMQGDTLKTSLTTGIVSKLLPNVIQIDAYANHGSSGSPVFDEKGWVVGVVYGGESASAGRVTYAVPGVRIAEMLEGSAKEILRP